MTGQEAIDLASRGMMIECTHREWQEIRSDLHKYAAKQIDGNQDVYAQIALMEIKRLDDKFKKTI